VELYFCSPNTPSWCGARLKRRDSFSFTFTFTSIFLYTTWPPLLAMLRRSVAYIYALGFRSSTRFLSPKKGHTLLKCKLSLTCIWYYRFCPIPRKNLLLKCGMYFSSLPQLQHTLPSMCHFVEPSAHTNSLFGPCVLCTTDIDIPGCVVQFPQTQISLSLVTAWINVGFAPYAWSLHGVAQSVETRPRAGQQGFCFESGAKVAQSA